MEIFSEVAHYIRSKNAGPFWITIDVFCGDEERYKVLSKSPSLNPEVIARAYKVNPDSVRVFFLPSIHTIKISYPRARPQGSKYEMDMHAGQQYVELGNLPV
ncbi:MAG: DUF4387 domain-containing protein [Clostridium sp.]|nr:DUF4387 domain-containing protein [Clostridium sp.]